MKRRLHHGALAAVAFAFGGEQTVAQQPRGALQAVGFDELVLVGDEHRLDEVGMLQEERRASGQRERHDVVGSERELLEKRERVTRGR